MPSKYEKDMYNCGWEKYGNVIRTLTKKVEGDQKDNKFTVPLKSKLPDASLFLRDENRVARELLMRQFLA